MPPPLPPPLKKVIPLFLSNPSLKDEVLSSPQAQPPSLPCRNRGGGVHTMTTSNKSIEVPCCDNFYLHKCANNIVETTVERIIVAIFGTTLLGIFWDD